MNIPHADTRSTMTVNLLLLINSQRGRSGLIFTGFIRGGDHSELFTQDLPLIFLNKRILREIIGFINTNILS